MDAEQNYSPGGGLKYSTEEQNPTFEEFDARVK
jgi:hypothetical protein